MRNPLHRPVDRASDSRPRRRWAGWRIVLLFVLFSGGTLCAEVNKEYQVKAAFLYNFAKFVDWPPGHFTDSERPIVIGIVGQDPFGEELQKIVRGRRVNGRALTIRSIGSVADARTADVIFIRAGAEQRLREMSAALLDAGVLTVGESDEFTAEGGMITFLLAGDKIRFAINLGPAERAGLKLSAQLLKLAADVRRKP